MRTFLLTVTDLGVEGETKLKDLFGENGYKFWHRLPNVWILVTPDDVTLLKIVDLIDKTVIPIASTILLEFDSNNLLVSVPRSMSEWFEKHLDMKFGNEFLEQRRKQENATQK